MQNWPGKLRARRKPQGQHGPIKRIVGDTPMVSLREARLRAIQEQIAQLETDPAAPTAAKAEALSELIAIEAKLKKRKGAS